MTRTAAIVAVAVSAWAGPAAASVPGEPAARVGQRFYATGIGAVGNPVKAVVQGDLEVLSSTMACINCHRRSGWGTSEGPLTTPPVVGSVLFNARTVGTPEIGVRSTGPGTRPAYDPASLLRAIRDGVDPGGRTLSPSMPRYAIGNADGQALVAYLQSLGGVPPQGVTASTLHLATITSADADPRQRDAVLGVLRAFVALKNGQLRNETRRRENGPWDMKAHYELYRDWELHEWSVEGHPRDWPRQLAAQYARQPVFAIVGGVIGGDWTPVHQFCEDNGVPCIFPLALAPPDRGVTAGFYTLYYSQGLALEAAALADHLRSDGTGRRLSILQVARCSSPGESAARQVERLLGGGAFVVRTQCVDGTDGPTAEHWRRLLDGRPQAVVSWLGADSLEGLGRLAASSEWSSSPPRVYLSGSLVGDSVSRIDGPLRASAFLLEPYVAPDEFEHHAARALLWLRSRGLDRYDRIAAANTLFAVTVVSDAVAKPRVLESREYLIEQIEHMVGRAPQPTAFPLVGLGALRRFASLGCSVVKLPVAPSGAFEKVRPWFVPEMVSTK